MLFVWIGLLLILLLALLVRSCWTICKRCGKRGHSVDLRTGEPPATSAKKKPVIRTQASAPTTKKTGIEEATTSTTV
jgi:hypothetical protein